MRLHEFKRDEALFKKHALVQKEVGVAHGVLNFFGVQGVADLLSERVCDVDAVHELRRQLVGALAQHERRQEPLHDADVGIKNGQPFGFIVVRLCFGVNVKEVVQRGAGLLGDGFNAIGRPDERRFNDLGAAGQRALVALVLFHHLRDEPHFVKEGLARVGFVLFKGARLAVPVQDGLRIDEVFVAAHVGHELHAQMAQLLQDDVRYLHAECDHCAKPDPVHLRDADDIFIVRAVPAVGRTLFELDIIRVGDDEIRRVSDVFQNVVEIQRVLVDAVVEHVGRNRRADADFDVLQIRSRIRSRSCPGCLHAGHANNFVYEVVIKQRHHCRRIVGIAAGLVVNGGPGCVRQDDFAEQFHSGFGVLLASGVHDGAGFHFRNIKLGAFVAALAKIGNVAADVLDDLPQHGMPGSACHEARENRGC